MITSMTGFGRSQTAFDGTDISVEMSSVNRRNLEISVSLPREWQSLERSIQAVAREGINRGKLYIQIQAVPTAGAAGFQWDDPGLDASIARLSEAASRHGISWQPDAETLVKLAALNRVETVLPDADSISDTLLKAVGDALGNLVAMREKEGSALQVDLQARLEELKQLLLSIRGHAEGTVTRYGELLLQRLKQSGLDLDLGDDRVLKEVAIFADKCDIAEEVTRLESHLVQFSESLGTGGPTGRKLEFLLQEINREFNTIGSKANNIEVNRQVIDAKNEIERIREQIQNIE